MNYSGYVRLHRRVRKNPVWTQLSPAVYKFFNYCIMEANFSPMERWYDGAKEDAVAVGSFVRSIRQMAKECHLGERQVRSALEHLDRLGCTRTRVIGAPGRTHEITEITVVNYGAYQSSGEKEGHAKGHANDTRKDTRTTRERHANDFETVENSGNCLIFNDGASLDRAPLKEEEVKKGRKEEIPAFPSDSGANGFRALVEWQMDETYAPLVEAYRSTGKPLIDEDFAEAHYAWKRLDFEQKQQAIRGVAQRVEAGVWNDPAFVPVPKRYLVSEWKRPVLAPRKGPERKSALAQMIEG